MPTREDRERFIEEAVRRLRDDAGAERVIVYGSQAEGTADPGSDVDLLVIVESDEQPLDRRIRLRRLLGGPGQPVPFDLVVLTPAEFEARMERGDPFIQQVLDRGRTLHAS